MEAIMLIGSRSYGIYLWHYPVMVLGTPIHEIGNPSYWRIFLLLLILMIAELSYRFIEMPIRKEGFRVYCQKYLICNKTSGKPYFSTKNINGYGSSFSACIFHRHDRCSG